MPTFHLPSGFAPAELYRRVWRTSLDEPGFALIRFDTTISSTVLRRAML
jgi:hypothetical protein